MKKIFSILFVVVVILFILKQCDNPQHEEYTLYPMQDIVNIRNKGFGQAVFEVGNFDYYNSFLDMTKTYSLMKYSILKEYDQGNYILQISDFDNEKVVINSEYKFYNDIGKAWFWGEGKNLDEKYSFFASIVDNNIIKTPIKIKLYDDNNNYVFGYVRCDYKHSMYKEEKISYIPLTKESYGYSVDFNSKIQGFTLQNFSIFIVFKETANEVGLKIETNGSQFQHDIELSETMELDDK